MGRPRTPTNILLLRGVDKVHPDRMKDREDEPQPSSGIGEPPKHLKAGERRAWNEIVHNSPPGVLFNSDRVALELAACLLVEFRTDRKEMKASDRSLLASLLARFGFTPADRSKVRAVGVTKKNSFTRNGKKKP